MKKSNIYKIDGQDYLATGVVSLNGKRYQEFYSSDIARPDIIYAEKIDSYYHLVEDWDTYYSLREKYAIDKRSLHGELVLYINIPYVVSKKNFFKDLKLISDLKDVALRTEEKTYKSGLKEQSYFVDSGEHKGELLFTSIPFTEWKNALII